MGEAGSVAVVVVGVSWVSRIDSGAKRSLLLLGAC